MLYEHLNNIFICRYRLNIIYTTKDYIASRADLELLGVSWPNFRHYQIHEFPGTHGVGRKKNLRKSPFFGMQNLDLIYP